MDSFDSLSSGKPATEKTVKELRDLLGHDVVLVPVKYGAKKPLLPAWQELSTVAMEDREYLAGLVGGNIGVLLGTASNGLVTFDFDDKEPGRKFFAANEPSVSLTALSKVVCSSSEPSITGDLYAFGATTSTFFVVF